VLKRVRERTRRERGHSGHRKAKTRLQPPPQSAPSRETPPKPAAAAIERDRTGARPSGLQPKKDTPEERAQSGGPGSLSLALHPRSILALTSLSLAPTSPLSPLTSPRRPTPWKLLRESAQTGPSMSTLSCSAGAHHLLPSLSSVAAPSNSARRLHCSPPALTSSLECAVDRCLVTPSSRHRRW
jgi:hypothetical protein